MAIHPYPTTARLDVTGANGTPFRFVLSLEAQSINYYDRRYSLVPGDPGYGANQTCEDGQSCGPALVLDTFDPQRGTGIRGWHSVEAWDVDAWTMHLVSSWVQHTIKAHAAHEERLR